MRSKLSVILLALTLGALGSAPTVHAEEHDLAVTIDSLLRARQGDGLLDRALADLDRHWHPGYVPMLVEVLRVSSHPDRYAIIDLMEKKIGTTIGGSISDWFDWIWKQKIEPHPRYADIKAVIYRRIDPRFAKYFDSKRKTEVRLDEVRWGGVVQDGIPPLRRPEMIDVSEATYLAETDVVFGIEIEGDVRAYPKRILAWHEMFTDKVGGVEVTGVY